MNKLLHLTDDGLFDYVIAQIKKANPRIRIGERMSGPIANVHSGKLVQEREIVGDVITLDFRPKHVEPLLVTVEAQSVSIRLSELDSMEWSSFGNKWLYPYTVLVPHREWMLKHKPGDTVMVFDDQYDASPLTLTEQHFKDHEYLIFKYGTSD